MLGLGNILTKGGALLGFPNKYSFNFDGSNDYLDCGDSLGNSLGTTTALTLSVWVKNDNSSQDAGIFKIGDGNAGNFSLSYYDGDYYLNLDTNDSGSVTAYAGFASTDTSSWHHIVAVYNGSNAITIYFDGSAQSFSASSGTPPSSIDFTGLKTLVGQYYSKEWDGLIDEVAVWNAVLSADDVAKIYKKPVDFSKASTYATDRTSNLKLWLRAGDKVLPESDASIARSDFYTDFDGTNDYIAGVGQSFTGAFSISFWIKPNNVTDSGVGILGTTTLDSNYIRQFSQSVNIRTAGSGSTYGTGNVLVVDEWIYLAITRDSSNVLKWFVNGAYIGSSATHSGTFTFDNFARSVSGYFEGAISNVALYKTALDAQTISQMAKSRFTPMRDNRFSVVDFDGTNDHINCGSDTSLALATDFTISVWFNSDDVTGYERLVNRGNYNSGFIFGLNDDNLDFTFKDADDASHTALAGGTNMTANRWYHGVAVSNSSTGKVHVYLNGVDDGNASITHPIQTPSADFRIGSDGSNHFNGKISSVSVYNVAKSAEEVYALYSKGITYNESSESGLVGLWRMGSDTSKAYPTIADSSSNSNDGTMTSMASDDIVQQMVAGYDMGAFESTEELSGERFGTADNDWTVSGSYVSISNGVLSYTGSGVDNANMTYSGSTYGAFTFATGKLYKLVLTIANTTTARFKIQTSSSSTVMVTSANYSSGTHTFYLSATSSHNGQSITIRGENSQNNFDITEYSLKEVLQSEVSDTYPAIIDVNEPVLGVEAVTSISNQGGNPYETFSGASGNFVESMINSSGSGQAFTNEVGANTTSIYKIVISLTVNSGSVPTLSANQSDGTYTSGDFKTGTTHSVIVSGTNTYYTTFSATDKDFLFLVSGTTNLSDVTISVKEVSGNPGTMTNQDSADLVYSSVLPDQSFLATGVNSAYNFIDLDGADQYIVSSANSGISGSNPFSISAWINPDIDPPDTGNDYMLFTKTGSTSANQMACGAILRVSGVNYLGFLPHTNDLYSNHVVPNNTWSHVLITYSSGTYASGLKIYLNGVVHSSLTARYAEFGSTTNATPNIASTVFEIGKQQDSNSSYWNGQIGQVAIWNKDISSDVGSIYNAGRHTNLLDSYSDNLLGYWAMSSLDVSTGLSDSLSTIYDRSGNSNHGTPTNADAGDLASSPNAEPNGYAKGDTNRSTTIP